MISLFAGGGGSSLGYSMAGFRELLAVEMETDACKTFARNFPDVPLYSRDISQLSVDECTASAGIEPGDLDVLDGSPPCQGFSTSGKRILDDPRNALFNEFVRLLSGLRPRAFIMENVSGLVKGKMRLAFAEMLAALKDAGYRVRARLLNAAYFEVPQDRRRVIFIGVRRDLPMDPTFPKAVSHPITFRRAIEGVPDHCDRPLHERARRYAPFHTGGWGTDYAKYGRINGDLASAMNLQWAQWDRICGTLLKTERDATGIVHPRRHRYLNLDEAKRIGSFPEPFRFTDRRKGWERIGNAVPPLMMRHIATHVRRILASDGELQPQNPLASEARGQAS